MQEEKLYIMTTKKLSGLYTITNRENGKIYIGESLDIYRRWHKEHIPQLRKNCHYNEELQNDFNKYGEENFSFEILERYSVDNPITTKARILILEGYYITQFKKSGIELYNSENTLVEILSGNKKPSEGDALFNVIISTLKNYCIKDCDGFSYFDKRKTIGSILFGYIVPKKGETKTLILKEFEKYLEGFGKQKQFFVCKHFLNFVKNGKESKIEIEEIKKEKVKDVEKMAILFSEHRERNKGKCKMPVVENDNPNEVYPPISGEEVRFSNLFKIFAKDGILPKDYSYYKVRNYLADLKIIEIKEIDCNGTVKRVTYATDDSLNKKILRIIGRKKYEDVYAYNYVFTKRGIDYMKNIFANLDEKIKIELFTINEQI